jgi:predicted nucleotidyltransferase
MEPTYNELPEKLKHYLMNLSNYVDSRIYFFGSIQRLDYLPGISDIDCVLFVENEKSATHKLAHFLQIDPIKIKKVFFFKHKYATGYKVKFIYEYIKIELIVYNEIYKDVILDFQYIEMSPIIACMLYILKVCFYKLEMFSYNVFKKIKNSILCRYGTHIFIVIPNKYLVNQINI